MNKEDYSWIDINKLPKDYSCLEVIKYFLKGTKYWIDERETMIDFKWDNLDGKILVFRRDELRYEMVLEKLESVLEAIREMEKDTGREEWFHPLYRNLYEILKKEEWCIEYIEYEK